MIGEVYQVPDLDDFDWEGSSKRLRSDGAAVGSVWFERYF
jgi:hypothetical protein